MKSLSDIAHSSVQRANSGAVIHTAPGQTMVAPEAKEALSNHVFKMLNGFYGKKFIDQFSTGSRFAADGVNILHGDPRVGQDRGIWRTRSIWGQSLIRYSAETISEALSRCKREHLTWPPTLPEFEALCEACKPRPVAKVMTEAERQALDEQERLGRAARQELRAREDTARRAARGGRTAVALPPNAPPPDPMLALHEAMATALAANGMDEGQALRWVEQKITPELVAAWAKGDLRGP